MKPNPAQNLEHKAEAERLALLPAADQRAIIAMHKADANNPRVPKRDREFARERAAALERLLKLKKKGRE